VALGGSSVYLLRTNRNVSFLISPDEFFYFCLLLRASLVALGGSSDYLLRTNENVTFLSLPDDFFDFW